MDNNKYFFAVDLGATSGRTIIGTLAEGKVQLEELTRFDNSLIETGGHFYWDIFALYNEIIKGLKLVAKRQLPITSIGIDTWGVDFVCIGEDNAILRNPIAYRDPFTFEAMDEYFSKCVDKKRVYETTGIQFMNFNSLFQLYAMRRENNVALANAKKILFVPDALSWMLTGKTVCEYTIASTSPRTGTAQERGTDKGEVWNDGEPGHVYRHADKGGAEDDGTGSDTGDCRGRTRHGKRRGCRAGKERTVCLSQFGNMESDGN